MLVKCIRMFRVFVILFLCVTAAVAESEKTTLRKLWASPVYATNAVPVVWCPKKIPATVSDVKVFERFELKTEGLSIPKFISRYGLPSRYLTTRQDKGQDFL